MYGIPAMDKMNKQITIVVKTRNFTNGIKAPSITIAAKSKATGTGWKKRVESSKPDDRLVHQCKNFTSVEECLNSETITWHHFVKDTILGYNDKLSLINETNTWNPDFTYFNNGRSYTFHPKRRIGPQFRKDQIIIPLDKGYYYFIFVHEENFFILNDNSCALPTKFVKLSPDTLNEFKFFYKMSAIQHIEKNVPGDPCVEDDHYSFAICVKENLARKVGCRPSWDIWSDQTIRNCTNIEEHR